MYAALASGRGRRLLARGPAAVMASALAFVVGTPTAHAATRHVWVGVRSVTLVDTGQGVAPTVISGKDFRSRIAAGKRVRIAMSQTAAGTCYLANASGTIRS